MTTFRGVCGGGLTVLFAVAAAAQPNTQGVAPSGAAPAASGTAGFGATPPATPSESPAAQPPSPAMTPEQAQPAPQGYPPPQSYPAAPSYAPAPSQPTPQSYSAPPPAEALSPERDATATAANRLQPGPYFGAWVGVGAPFGGDATTGRGVGYREGAGGLGTLGWAFIPNFGVDLFVHYNASSLAVDENAQSDLRINENSAHVWLYGLEGRGIIGSGPMFGWASLGLSLGSGSLTTAESGTPSFGAGTVKTRSEDSVRFKVMPVLSLGAEIEVTRGLGIGPMLRWYITNVEHVCDSTDGTVTNATFPPTTQSISDTRCSNRVSDITVPDIVFLGAGLTYRIGT